MKKKILSVVLVLSLVTTIFAGATVNAAQPKIYEFKTTSLKKEQIYKGMDVTGDGRLDTVKVTYSSKKDIKSTAICKILVNGKQVFSQTRNPEPVWSISLIRLKNRKVLC